MKTGIFDSGIGGLGVLREALLGIPETEFIFYADRDHVPYGERTEEEILSYSRDITQFLVGQGCDAVVIACNTATSVAAAALREEYADLPILGMEPAVKPALETTAGKVMVIATPVTVRENKLKDLIDHLDHGHRVQVRAMPGLVRLAESDDFESPEAEGLIGDLAYEMSANGGYTALVLGCTHFNYFRPQFRKLLPENVEIFDGNKGTVRNLAKKLEMIRNRQGAGVSGCLNTDTHCQEGSDVTEYLRRVRIFESGRDITSENGLLPYVRLFERLRTAG